MIMRMFILVLKTGCLWFMAKRKKDMFQIMFVSALYKTNFWFWLKVFGYCKKIELGERKIFIDFIRKKIMTLKNYLESLTHVRGIDRKFTGENEPFPGAAKLVRQNLK